MNTPLINKTPRNIIGYSFVKRFWALIAFVLLANWLIMSPIKYKCLGVWEFDEMKGGQWVEHTVLQHFGAIACLPAYGGAALLMMFFCIHVAHRRTVDADENDGTAMDDWQDVPPTIRVYVRAALRIGYFIGFCILFGSFARATEPVDQVARWQQAQLNPKWSIALDTTLRLYERNKWRYEKIQAMRNNGVPAAVIFCLHYRESDNDFRAHAHEGSSLQHRTRYEPKGRLPTKEPPYTFEQSAEDAYYICEHPPLDRINWRDKQAALDKMESFNGFGYRNKGIAAPYLFSGTTLYSRGKYVRDGVFDRNAVDQQLGCVAILKRFAKEGIRLSFDATAPQI